MLVENQKVEIIWNVANKKWYEEKGYEFTKIGDKLIVKAEDLTRNAKNKVEIICDYCGNHYFQEWKLYMDIIDKNQKNACCNCIGRKRNELTLNSRSEKTFNKLNNICSEKGYILLTTKNEIINTKNSVVKIICPIHGYQEANMHNFLVRKRCPKCGIDERTNSQRNNKDEIEQKINSINGNILLNKNDYVNAHTNNLKILCGSCKKNIFIINYSNYCHGVHRCKECSSKESRGEFKIRKFLENNKIDYIKEYWFSDCRDINPLPFDFYLPKYNYLIEFDGQQHYDTWFYRNLSDNPDFLLKETQRRDKIKTDYCKNNNIHLIRIPYFEEKNINNILKNELKL